MEPKPDNTEITETPISPIRLIPADIDKIPFVCNKRGKGFPTIQNK